jgi:outer membrane protein OmpA-like peptidoglycan-associated protein
MRLRLPALALIIAAAVPSLAHAESGVLNLHIDLGAGIPFLGDQLVDDGMGNYTIEPMFVGTVGVDWQLAVPFALELIAGGGYGLGGFVDETTGVRDEGSPYGTAALGGRFRFLDNREGYANETGGDYDGNGWVSAHLGWHFFDGHEFGIDLGGGYEWSVIDPVQLGLFVRGALLLVGDNPKVDAIVYGGVNASFELIGGAEALDSDGDGLSDERELAEHHTDPQNPDTDGDQLGDGLEVDTETNPTLPDTDGDGAQDGVEDANRDGVPDPSECDPRLADTDGGGVPDGFEMQNGTNCRDRSDDDQDGDGVPNHLDRCPNTPRGEEVDQNGCIVMRAQIVLDGITFAFDSAEILPESENTLNRGLQILLDNPEARVEIGGHTDNVGGAAYNNRLSRQRADSVRSWLVEHGIEANRLTVRGYGMAQPRASNDTEEGRAQNRRIEFRSLNQPD